MENKKDQGFTKYLVSLFLLFPLGMLVASLTIDLWHDEIKETGLVFEDSVFTLLDKPDMYAILGKRKSSCSVGESGLYEHRYYHDEMSVECIAIDAMVYHSSITLGPMMPFIVLFQSEPTDQEIVDAVKKRGEEIVEGYIKKAEQEAKERAEIDRLNNLLK